MAEEHGAPREIIDLLVAHGGTGEPAFENFAGSETTFFLKVADGKVEFVRDEAGKVTGFILRQGDRTTHAKRIGK